MKRTFIKSYNPIGYVSDYSWDWTDYPVIVFAGNKWINFYTKEKGTMLEYPWDEYK